MYDSKHDQRMISHMIRAIKSRDHYMIGKEMHKVILGIVKEQKAKGLQRPMWNGQKV